MRPRSIHVGRSHHDLSHLSAGIRLACFAFVFLAGWGTVAATQRGEAALIFRHNDGGLERGSSVEIPTLIRAEDEALVVQLDIGRVVRLRPHSVAYFSSAEQGAIRVTVGGGIVEVHATPDDLALAGARSMFVLEPLPSGPESVWEFVDDPSERPKSSVRQEPEEDRERRRMSRRAGQGSGRRSSGR